MQGIFVAFSVSLFCLSSFMAAAQTSADVKGIVRSTDGQPLQNVSIIAKNSLSDFTSGAQTNAEGMFTFSKLPLNGKYSFTFSICKNTIF